MSVFIIAEAGVNHNGSLELAKKMVDVAKNSGADGVKFQTFISEKLVSKHAKKAEYQKSSVDEDDTQLKMLKKLELSFEEFKELREYCLEKDIMFMSTAFDLESVDFLSSLNLEVWKIPSGDLTNLPYLIKVAKLNKPIILSTGMSNLDEIRSAVKVLSDNGNADLTVLHCTTEYPTPFTDVNLNAMITIKKEFGVKVGYSDHTMGTEVPIAAVALGASVIEKHFTLSRDMDGPDHKASLEPEELKLMVESIRHIEEAIGDGVKKPSCSEMKNESIARKSIVAKKNIKSGELFSEDNLTVKRPGTGISPMSWFEVLGNRAKRDFEEDELIEI